MTIRILTPKDTYTIDYPEAIEYAKQQTDIFWHPEEIHVEKDLHDLKTNFTEAEYHGVISTLKLFTLYELQVGNEYWQNYVSQVFPRPDIQRMASTFGFFETGIHAPFYSKINEILGLDTDEFYNSYLDDSVLKNRMAWIGKRTTKRDTVYNILKSVGIFSMIEGAILYSSFAFLKHFNSNGKNKLSTINAGINFSINDETCLSSDTEVLTIEGWKFIKDVNLTDKVCQYDVNTKIIDYVNPLKLITSQSNTSYVFESDNYHQHVTPPHRMIFSDGECIAEQADETKDYLISSYKLSGDDLLTDEDKLIIDLIVEGKESVDWIYSKLEFVSSEWARSAVEYYLTKDLSMSNIKQAFDTLANLAGGIIEDDQFKLLKTEKVKKTKLTHNSKDFYCLTVPGSAFVIRSNNKISITGNCHSEAGAWLFRTLMKEAIDDNQLSQEEQDRLRLELEETTKVILEHETIIINKIFEKGAIKGISDVQLVNFVQSRLDICLKNLGYKRIFKPSYNPIAEWIYNDVDSSILHDFFSQVGNDYNRKWSESKFAW